MRALLAALPIALLVALLLGTRLPAGRAAWIALAAALATTFAVFGFTDAPHVSLAWNLAGVVTESTFIAATILWILLPALAIHELQVRTGALRVLREALTGAAPDASTKALLVGWFFALFLEGAAGFGTPLMVAAPMLVALGTPPAAAVAVTLLGHAAGVTFGAIGTPVLAQAELTTAAMADLTRYTALLVVALAWILALFVLRTGRGGEDEAFAWRRAISAAVCFGVPYALVAIGLGPELPTLAGALLGGVAFVALTRRTPTPAAAPHVSSKALARAAAPYLVLIAFILATRLAPPLKALATGFELGWTLEGGYSGSMLPLYHPGTLLFGALVIGGRLQGAGRADMGRALGAAAVRVAPAVVALVAMLTLSRLMLHTGMIAELAQAGVARVGALWPVLAPAVGALGSFVTGSATASNVLFTSLQDQAATSLALPVAVVLAAQGVGAAIGNAICPHNIIAGAAAVGAAGREGEILRRTLPACAVVLVLAGLFALLLSRWVAV